MSKNTPLVDLKSKLENRVHYIENRRESKIEYPSPTNDNEENMKFDKFEVKTNCWYKLQ